MATARKKKTKSPRTRRARPATRPATPRQAAILTFIRDYSYRHGYSPTYEEIAAEYGITKVTVFEHLSALEERGLIRRDKHKARSLELAEQVEFVDQRDTCLPLIGRIAAGAPIEAIENREALDLATLFSSKNDTYVLEVKGDSMIEDQIADGDYVVIERRENARNGETVVALLENGEATLKRYYREKGRVRLQPANSSYEPIYPESLRIQGIVIGVLRRL